MTDVITAVADNPDYSDDDVIHCSECRGVCYIKDGRPVRCQVKSRQDVFPQPLSGRENDWITVIRVSA